MSAVAPRSQIDPAQIELVPMRRRHVRQVMKIEAQVYPRPWSSALFLQEIVRRSDRVYYVAKWDSTVVGYAGLITSGQEAHITTIAVDPEFHRLQIGTKLMLGIMDAAIQRGAETVSLEVRKSNYGAQRMYETFGFRPVGVRPGYYAETGEDAIVMWTDGTETAPYAERLAEIRGHMEAKIREHGGARE